MTINALGDAFKNESNKTSTNYGIDSKGKIAVYVDEDDAAWGMSNSAINNRCVSIMMASSTDQAPYACSQDALNALVMLTADICIRNNISGLRWNDDEGYAKKAANGGPVDDQNVFIHRWFKKNVVDPGEWVYDNLHDIVDSVNTKILEVKNSYRRIVFVGDSRSAQIHNAVGADMNVWATSGEASVTLSKRKKEIIATSLSASSSLCIMGSPFDMDKITAKKYAEFINDIATDLVENGCPVYYVTINPVSNDGYSKFTNVSIEKYNSTVKKNLESFVGYIDTYNAIKDIFKTTNGYSFDKQTNLYIYSTIVQQAARMSSGIGASIGLNLDPSTFNPYIILYGRDDEPPYGKLSNHHISGAIIEAGYRYTASHARTTKFDNPNLVKQITNLDRYKLPYGMYTICRARTTGEAKEEIKYLQYQVYRHPPKLGVWLMLELKGTKSENNSIIETYQEELTNLGLQESIGIICSRKFLEKFDWESFQDKFYLYLVDHVDDLDKLGDVFTPEFFDIDGTVPTTAQTSSPSDILSGTSLLTGTLRQKMIEYARTFIGTPYVLGASGMAPNEPLDCGQFVCAVYYHFGMDLRPNRTNITVAYGKQVTKDSAQPGDVVHYPYNPKYSNAHVAIYFGDNKIIEATSPGGVQISPLGNNYDRIVNIIDNWKK